MSEKHFNKDTNALYAKQLKALGLDKGKFENIDSQGEQNKIESLDLPELNLPTKKTSWNFKPVIMVFGVAAGLLVFLTPLHVKSPRLTEKGGSKINVYYKYAEKAERFEPGTTLKSGSQIRVELVPARLGYGFLYFFDSSNNSIGPIDESMSNQLATKPGIVGTFSGSVKLTGENVGEKVVVTACSNEAAKNFIQLPIEKRENTLKAALALDPPSMAGFDCQVIVQKLR